jgi:hypothetical protein
MQSNKNWQGLEAPVHENFLSVGMTSHAFEVILIGHNSIAVTNRDVAVASIFNELMEQFIKAERIIPIPLY